MEITDPTLLTDSGFTDLLSYVGMDPEQFENGAVCAVGTKESGFEYFDTFAASDKEITAKAGTLSLKKVEGYEYFFEDEYTVFFNGSEGM